jgi:hypothetical protein
VKSFVSVHCFHKAVYKKKLNAPSISNTTATIIVYHNAPNAVTANDQHTITTVIRTFALNILQHKAQNPLITANNGQPTNTAFYLGKCSHIRRILKSRSRHVYGFSAVLLVT